MSAQKVLIVVGLVALAATLVFAAPKQHIRSVDLAEVINKTVCPIHVDVDDVEDRIPRRIQFMRCAQDPNHWCRKQNIPPYECCQHRHDSHLLECVEMRDTVMVYYKSTKKTTTMEVPVGCTCMIVQSTTASALPAGPT